MTNYVGIAPMTIVRRTNGQAQTVLAGGPVPGDAAEDDLARLLAEEFIVESDEFGGMLNDVPSQVPTAASVRAAKTASKPATPAE